ncbi:MAG: replication initiation protein, partial [Bacteroidota bacterium]
MNETIKKVKNYTVVQANDLIRNKKDFSLWELRVFAMLASHVRKEDSDFQTYKFRIKDIIDLFDCKSNNLYDELREVPERLHSKIIRIPYTDKDGKNRTRRYNLVSMSDFPDGEDMEDGEHIMLRFDKDLKPLLLQLGEHFTIYKFYNILKLRSTYVFQLYEIL